MGAAGRRAERGRALVHRRGWATTPRQGRPRGAPRRRRASRAARPAEAAGRRRASGRGRRYARRARARLTRPRPRTKLSPGGEAGAAPATSPANCRSARPWGKKARDEVVRGGLICRFTSRALWVQVVPWGRRRGLAKAFCRFATCFAGVPWSTRESVSAISCSTSQTTSFISISIHHAASAAYQREEKFCRRHQAFGRLKPQKQTSKKKQANQGAWFSSRLILISGLFSICVLLEGGRSLKRGELFHATQPQIPRPALPYRSCLVACYLIVPTSMPLFTDRRALAVRHRPVNCTFCCI